MPAGMVLAGAVVLILWGSTTAGIAVGMTVIGIACVIAVSLVFLAIGRAEDEERAAAGKPPPPPDPHEGEAARRRRERPPRRPT